MSLDRVGYGTHPEPLAQETDEQGRRVFYLNRYGVGSPLFVVHGTREEADSYAAQASRHEVIRVVEEKCQKNS